MEFRVVTMILQLIFSIVDKFGKSFLSTNINNNRTREMKRNT